MVFQQIEHKAALLLYIPSSMRTRYTVQRANATRRKLDFANLLYFKTCEIQFYQVNIEKEILNDPFLSLRHKVCLKVQ